jgi:hypothetical protein
VPNGTITINAISSPQQGAAFTVSGTLKVTPAMTVKDDAGAATAVAAPALSAPFSFSHAGLTAGTHTVTVSDTVSGASGSAQVVVQAPATIFITPGNGQFTVNGHTYKIDATKNYLQDNVAMADGGNTGQGALYNGTVYGQDASSLNWYTWTGSAFTGPVAAPPSGGTGHFTVTGTGGFKDHNGVAWAAKGANVDVWDAMANLNGILSHFHGLTMVRVVCRAGTDSFALIDQVVQAYTSHGIVVELEDHSDSMSGNNVAWYQTLATTYKNNPRVFLETPNEPGDPNTAQHQIAIINAIRAAGFLGPVGIQPLGGWDSANFPTVLAGVTSTANLYGTPHAYYDGNDPNAPTGMVAGYIDNCTSRGLWAVIDEFGNSINGGDLDQYGQQCIDAVVAAQRAGHCGACFWAAGNGYHANGCDSLFLDTNGNGLTNIGQQFAAAGGWLA